ncbi:MAG: ATP-binding cassette domain-containing protein, partial [Christensenellales bacterium]
DMLERVELKGEEKSLKKELSGGMAQRANMARAFVYPAKVLLLDEPFKGLDPSMKGRLIKTFLRLYENEKRTVIFVTHAIDEALLLADKVVIVKDSPVRVDEIIEIDIPKEKRILSDDSLVKTRKKLLDSYE